MPLPRVTPRYQRFLLTGALAGLVATIAIVVLRGEATERPAVLFVYLGILLAGLGALAGGLLAVILESRRRR